jgi:hypothetical protein
MIHQGFFYMDTKSSTEHKAAASKTPDRPIALSEILNISTTTGISPIHTPRGGLSEALDPHPHYSSLTECSFFSIAKDQRQRQRQRSYSSPKDLASQLTMETQEGTNVAFSILKAPSPIAVLMAEEQFFSMLRNETLEAIRAKDHPLLQHTEEEAHLGFGSAEVAETPASNKETTKTDSEEETIFSFDGPV